MSEQRAADLAEWNDRMFEKHPTPYHGLAGWVERARLAAIARAAAIGPDDRVLEVGCEAGTLLLSLPQPARLVGFDISAKALAQARERATSEGRRAEFFQGDASEPLPFSPGDFSVIVCSEMLEHVDDPRRVLERIHAIAEPETRIVFTVPYEKPKLAIKKLLTSLGLTKWLLPGIEDGMSEWHLHEFSREKLVTEMQGLFGVERMRVLLGLHVIAEVRKLRPEAPRPRA